MTAAGAAAAAHPLAAHPKAVHAPVQGVVAQVAAAAGQGVAQGQVLLVLESMKMEVPVAAPCSGTLLALHAGLGEAVEAGAELARVQPGEPPGGSAGAAAPPGPGPAAVPSDAPLHGAGAPGSAAPRADLQALLARRALLEDAARPQAMARRHAQGLRSARENVADLLDAGSFSEYGALAVAAQRSRRSEDDLQRHTPADGLLTGTGTVSGQPCAVMAYDYTVLAGTQGVWNHAKADRLLALAQRQRLPVVLFAEGGGGRPGDVDWHGIAGLDCTTFARLAGLSGQVPLVGIAAGRCFAGNAALLGCCDLVIAVEGASIGLGGPAMIEGGGLGVVAPDDIGPVDVLARAGAVDLRVASEADAVAVARRWLALVGPARGPDAQSAAGGDPASLREAVPASRRALVDVRAILRTVADAGTLMELCADFGASVVTAVARLGGRPVALAASHCAHLGGALDAPACDKLARFMQLADAHGLPLLTFVDTPGFMVGPASEATGMLRRAGRVFVTAAALRVPVLSVLLRRGFGLGAMALTAGHFHAPVATCAWPGGEFGPMGLEGAVRLGFRKELQALQGAAREALFERLLAEAVARGQALNMASHLEIDEVIDPAETRQWLLRHLAVAAAQPLAPRRPFIDPC